MKKYPGVIDVYEQAKAKLTPAEAARYKGRFKLVFRAGGKQKWVTVRGVTAKQASQKRDDLMSAARNGGFVESGRKVTLIQWLRRWLEISVKPLRRSQTTVVYTGIVESHLAHSPIGARSLQALRASDVEAYLASLKMKPASVALHLAVIRTALQKAVRDHLVPRNVAKDGIERPRVSALDVRDKCWTADEARSFLVVARQQAPQVAAYFTLLLDAGLRRQEVAGLQWRHVDLDAGTLKVEQQLMPRGRREDGGPVFGPTKTGKTRDIPLDAGTVTLLHAHRASQSRLKLANRAVYLDDGLVFAREQADLLTPRAKLGQPLPTDRLARTEFNRLVKLAGARPISLHGLRHTTASLWVANGESVRDVADRLGHADVAMTLNTYTHATGTQADAANRLGRVLHG